MQNRAVIDSGPLIALFNGRDSYHPVAVDFIKNYKGQLYTTIAVLTEVTHLLGYHSSAQLDFLRWVKNGAINLVNLESNDLERLCELTEQYSDIPMDFADASLVIIAEKCNIRHVVSIDSDFLIYRTLSNGYLENLIN